MRLSQDAAVQMANEFQPTYRKLEWLNVEILAHLAPTLTSEKAREYLQHGVCRRIKVIARCVANVFTIFPPQRTALLGSHELNDVQINLHAFVMNVYGIFDNVAWVYILEQGRASSIKGGRQAIGLFDKRTQEHLSQDLRDYLGTETLTKWFSEYAKNYRDALAHRIPPYIPPFTATKEESAKWNDLDSKERAAIKAQQFDEVERLRAEKNATGKVCGAFLHSVSNTEGTRPVMLHPQLLCDALTVAELLEKVRQDVQKNGWEARDSSSASDA